MHAVELGSFNKAAMGLDIARPTLNYQVSALDVDPRETLMLRNGRCVALTNTVQRLYGHGVNILQALAQDGRGANRDAPVGRITIGLPPSAGRQLKLPLIDGFQRRLRAARLTIFEGLFSHISE